MLKGPYTEAKTKKVVWDDEDPSVVGSFVSWLYTQQIVLDLHTIKRDSAVVDGLYAQASNDFREKEATTYADTEMEELKIFLALYKVWILADKRGTAALCNQVIDTLHQTKAGNRMIPLLDDDIWAWNNSAVDSRIRTMIVERRAIIENLRYHYPDGLRLPVGFETSIMRWSGWVRGDPEFDKGWERVWAKLDLCRFHVHANSVSCRGKEIKNVDNEGAEGGTGRGGETGAETGAQS